jgi:hypothetical protein
MSVGAPTFDDVQRPRYDRNFEPAIREGLLSVQEALRRGNRNAYAEDLSRRYLLSTELALEVTDNRARLFDVLQKTGQIPGHPAPRKGTDGVVKLQLVTLLFGSLVLGGLFGVQQWQRQGDIARRVERASLSAPAPVPAPRAHTPSAPAAVLDETRMSIERDELGRVTKISAGHPADVLAAFCSAARGVTCVTKEIRPSEPRFPGRRMGYLTVAHTAEDSRVVPIRRDHRSGRWYAGTGLGPIVSDGADERSDQGEPAAAPPND